MSRLTPSSRITGLASTAGAKTTTVSIPSGCTWALVAFWYYSGTSSNPPTSVSLDGQSATRIDGAEDNTADQVTIYKVSGFSTGASKTLAWTNPSGYTATGLIAGIEYRNGTPTYGTHGSGFGTTASTASLANSNGDEIISAYVGDPATAITPGAGQSKLDETDDLTANLRGGFTTETATGTGDVQSVSGDICGIASTVVTVTSDTLLAQALL